MKATSSICTEVSATNAGFSSETVGTASKMNLRSVKVVGQANALPFANRVAAGRLLSRCLLSQRSFSEPIVLAVSPGATQVAEQISAALHAPLDLLFTEDVCLPWQRDIRLATVNSDGGRALDEAACRSLRLSRYFVYNCIARTEGNLEARVRACRGGLGQVSRFRKCIILVDDGQAPPMHLAAAIRSLRKHDATEIVFAAPFATLECVKAIADEVNLCLLLAISDPLQPASSYYVSFPTVHDNEIAGILKPRRALESLTRQAAVAVG